MGKRDEEEGKRFRKNRTRVLEPASLGMTPAPETLKKAGSGYTEF